MGSQREPHSVRQELETSIITLLASAWMLISGAFLQTVAVVSFGVLKAGFNLICFNLWSAIYS